MGNEEKVVVACRIRNGLNIMGITVRGYFYPHPGEATPKPTPADSFGGYGLTFGFPKKLWDEWFIHNKDSDMVRWNHIMAADTSEALKALIAQRNGVRIRTFGSKLYTG